MAFGENGLITQAKKAKDMTLNSVTAEQEGINSVMSEYLNVMAEDSEIPVVPPKPTVPSDWDTSIVTPVLSEDNIYVPVPKGFTASTIAEEKSVKDGFVIKQGDNGAATTGVNEFVWIPVDSTSLGEMYAVEEKALSTYTGVDAKTSVYSKLRQGTSSTGGAPGSTSNREPDILIDTTYGDASTTTDRGINLIKAAFGFTGTNEQILDQFADMLVSEYETTYASIQKYQGFYVGRYELTGSTATPTVQKGQAVLTGQNWYQLYKACRNVVAAGTENGAQSTMIYGNQWDEVLDWLVDTGMSSTDVYTNSSSWGNYSDSTGAATTNSGTKQTSGKNEAWKANNIYDLAGNCWEWTQEASSTNYRFARGRFLRLFRL